MSTNTNHEALRAQAIKAFSEVLLKWYKVEGRHHLPWQKHDNWYTRLVSEVMLQQTQVVTVIPYFERFMSYFPTPEALAQADDESVMAQWAGLGYYSRARNLLKTVRYIVHTRAGVIPESAEAWAQCPGIGPSTAGAIAAFTTGERAVMCDGNAKRVIARVFAIEGYPGERTFDQATWEMAQALLPRSDDMADYTQALMDLGATVCKRQPECQRCPLLSLCEGHKQGKATLIPMKKPKKVRPTFYTTMLFVFQRDRLWLKKQTERTVWQDLWIPQMLARETEPQSVSASMYWPSEAIRSEQALSEWVHNFSHFQLIIRPLWVELTPEASLPDAWGDFEAYPIGDSEALPAMPAPVKSLFERIVALRNAPHTLVLEP